jgi:hypothetical protein
MHSMQAAQGSRSVQYGLVTCSQALMPPMGGPRLVRWWEPI